MERTQHGQGQHDGKTKTSGQKMEPQTESTGAAQTAGTGNGVSHGSQTALGHEGQCGGILISGDAESTNYVYTYLPGKLVVKHIAYITYEMRSSATAGGTISPKGTWYVEPYGSKTYTITVTKSGS